MDNDELLAFLSISPKPLPFRTLPLKATLSPFRLDFSAIILPPNRNLAFLIPLLTLLVTSDPFSYLNSPGIPLGGLNNGLNSKVPTPKLSKYQIVPRSLSPFIIITEDVIERGIISRYKTL